jgi:tetratricopeptide (TPR) repeat protein
MKSIVIYVGLFILLTVLSAQDQQKIDQAERLVDAGMNDSARVILEELYALYDEEPRVNYLLGTLSLRKGDYDASIDYLDDAIDSDETNHLYYYMLGNAYAIKAQNVGALKAMFAAPKMKNSWEKALELSPNFLAAKMSLFQYYLNAPGVAGGDEDIALEMANSVLGENTALGNLMLATYYFSAEEDIQKTDYHLQQSLTVDTSDSEFRRVNAGNANLLNTLGYHYMGEDDNQKSRDYFEKAIEVLPSSANPFDSMGDFYVHIARYDSALLSYERALKNNPTFAPSLLNKGKMLEKLGRQEEAIESYRKLVLEQPESRYAEEAQDRLDDLGENK